MSTTAIVMIEWLIEKAIVGVYREVHIYNSDKAENLLTMRYFVA
jgi:hypothetical protein